MSEIDPIVPDQEFSVFEEKLHDMESIQRATFNILEDYAGEGAKLRDMQTAAFNILEDAAAERAQLEAMQRASLNILEDFSLEKMKLEDNQSATFNILEDFAGEKERLEETQKATFNILEDFLDEREKLEGLQKAAFNILQDLNDEKGKLQTEITERKKTEVELESANRELEAFSYSVSHDLRAPLRGIDGFSQALLEDYGDKLDENGRTYISFVRTSSQQMAQLIDDLLSLSQMSRGEFTREHFNLSKLVVTITDVLRKTNEDRKVELSIQPDVFADADPRLVRVVIENLMNNAWKFTKGVGLAKIEFGQVKGEEDIFFVKDNGAGFDMSYSSKLFGAFQRLHTVQEFSGTGIGLATVRRVINRHGGNIWAEAEIGKGATFFFTLDSSRSGGGGVHESGIG